MVRLYFGNDKRDVPKKSVIDGKSYLDWINVQQVYLVNRYIVSNAGNDRSIAKNQNPAPTIQSGSFSFGTFEAKEISKLGRLR